MINISYSDINPDVKGVYTAELPKESILQKEKFFFSERFILIVKGHGEFNFSGNIVHTSPCTVLYIPAMEKYTSCFHDEQFITQICFDFIPYRGNVFSSMVFKLLTDRSVTEKNFSYQKINIEDCTLFGRPFAVNGVTDIYNRSTQFIKENTSRLNGYRLRMKLMLLDLIITIQRMSESVSALKESVLSEQIITYINEHCEERLTINGLGELFHYHPNHLNRIVRCTTGMTIYKYFTEAKLNRAQTLLTDTDLSMTQIALRLSFYDSSHFAAVFQKHRGISPSEYRSISRHMY